jgi:hypothetical protein
MLFSLLRIWPCLKSSQPQILTIKGIVRREITGYASNHLGFAFNRNTARESLDMYIFSIVRPLKTEPHFLSLNAETGNLQFKETGPFKLTY